MPDSIKKSEKNTFLKLAHTNIEEIRALIGLILARGYLGQGMHKLESLFDNFLGHFVYGATMSRNRFRFLLSCLYFVEERITKQTWSNDRAA